jgi:hypothetical protein
MESGSRTSSSPYTVLEPALIAEREDSSVIRQERKEAALREAQLMALAELARKRRRLGTLSQKQEVALENLVVSTVTKISDLVFRVLESRLVSNSSADYEDLLTKTSLKVADIS